MGYVLGHGNRRSAVNVTRQQAACAAQDHPWSQRRTAAGPFTCPVCNVETEAEGAKFTASKRNV